MSDDVIRTLGDTGIRTGSLTPGTSPLGRGTEPGSAQERVAVETARRMLAGPWPLIDTANEYAEGRAEVVLGIALAELRAEGAAVADIVTKVDRDPVTGVFDGDRVRRSFDESRARLGLDRVPLLHLHDPYTVTFAEAMGPGGAVEALVELRASGAVDAIGIAAGPIPLMTAYVETGAFDAVLCHNRYTLVDRSAEALFQAARARGMGVFNAAPFGAGILATGARDGAMYGYRPAPDELVAWVRRLEGICADHGVALPAVALRFATRSPLVDSTVVGVSSPGRFDELAALDGAVIPDQIWAEIDALGPAPSPVENPSFEADR